MAHDLENPRTKNYSKLKSSLISLELILHKLDSSVYLRLKGSFVKSTPLFKCSLIFGPVIIFKFGHLSYDKKFGNI